MIVFVDPLDGTREFVEGCVWNVQTLIGARRVTTNASCGTSIARHHRLPNFPPIGIAVRGEAVAGAVGLPFGSGSDDSKAAVVYAMVGAGPPRVFGEPRHAPRAFVAWIRAAPTNMMNHVRAGERADPQDPVHGGEVPSSGERPLLVAGPAFSPPETARRVADASLPRYRGGRPDLG